MTETPAKTPLESNRFKVLEINDGTVTLDLGDDRMIRAVVKDGVEVKKGAHVALDKLELDGNNEPVNPVVGKVHAS